LTALIRLLFRRSRRATGSSFLHSWHSPEPSPLRSYPLAPCLPERHRSTAFLRARHPSSHPAGTVLLSHLSECSPASAWWISESRLQLLDPGHPSSAAGAAKRCTGRTGLSDYESQSVPQLGIHR